MVLCFSCISIWHILILLPFLGSIIKFIRRILGLESALNSAEKLQREKAGKVSSLVRAKSLKDISRFLKELPGSHIYLQETVNAGSKFNVQQPRHVLVKFTAKWCSPCREIQQLVEDLRYKYICVFIEIDVDEADNELLVQSIKAVPTIRMYKWGVNVTEFSGLILCGEVIKIIAGNLYKRLSVPKNQPFWVFLNRLPSGNS